MKTPVQPRHRDNHTKARIRSPRRTLTLHVREGRYPRKLPHGFAESVLKVRAGASPKAKKKTVPEGSAVSLKQRP